MLITFNNINVGNVKVLRLWINKSTRDWKIDTNKPCTEAMQRVIFKYLKAEGFFDLELIQELSKL